jgi:hypothetical protein
MPWTAGHWPPAKADAIDTDIIMNEMRAALAERDSLVPAGWVPAEFSRWDPLCGTPTGGEPQPWPTVGNFQYEVQQMLLLDWTLQWWDFERNNLYAFADLCQDSFGKGGWTYDLTATDELGDPLNRWTPAAAVLFGELYSAINALRHLRVLPAISGSARHDSVYNLTFGISSWPDDRAATLAMFDGADNGQTANLVFHVGLGAEVFDDGSTQQWVLESREFRITFATGALAGCEITRAWLDFATEAPGGSADFSDTFTAEAAVDGGDTLGNFSSDSYGPQRFEVPAESIRTDGDTVFVIHSTRNDYDDRSNWSPSGPNYTSTYREGLAVVGPIRLIVEVNFEYHG